jgi:hypothetical protein
MHSAVGASTAELIEYATRSILGGIGPVSDPVGTGPDLGQQPVPLEPHRSPRSEIATRILRIVALRLAGILQGRRYPRKRATGSLGFDRSEFTGPRKEHGIQKQPAQHLASFLAKV